MMSEGIVIADYHHPGLFQSLMFLFEKRLGFELYRPYGKEWLDKGYILGHKSSYGGVEKCIIRMLTIPSFISATDPYLVPTLSVPLGRRLLLEEALDRSKEIKYVVASQHDTQYALARFVEEVCPKAALIRQCGNPNEHIIGTKHVLSSDLETYKRVQSTHHAVLYHQEFSDCLYFYKGMSRSNIIRQYINWAHNDIHNREFYLWFKRLCEPLGISCFEHGQGGENGEFDTHDQIAGMFNFSAFTLSHKWWDGYGMMVHQSYSCGRPVICFEDDYKNKLVGQLMEHGKTALFISDNDDNTIQQLRFAYDNKHKMQENARSRFEEVVNFDEEEQRIRKWLSQI